jgi:hypothetical protein
MNTRPRLNLAEIEASLRGIQATLPGINMDLKFPKSDFSDKKINYMMLAYSKLDEIVQSGINLFSKEHYERILDLNYLVLWGKDAKQNMELVERITQTWLEFCHHRINPIMKAYTSHQNSPISCAAEVYTRAVSRPPLFMYGGNQRTATVMISYILMNAGLPPFVLNNRKIVMDERFVSMALPYFGIATGIKSTNKEDPFQIEKLKLEVYKKKFTELLEKSLDEKYLL